MRAVVLGTSGSGKTTFARRLAQIEAAPLVELDALYHQPGWTTLPIDQFRARVASAVVGQRWIVDGNYGAVRDLSVARADHVVWLDYPRWLVMARVVRRSVARAVWRRELWNGNRESATRWLDPEHPIRWAWATFASRRAEFATLAGSPAWAHAVILRFRHPREAARWLEARNREVRP